MSYLQVLLIFIVPVVLVESVIFTRLKDIEKTYFLKGIILLAAAALVYTTPWDNYLIMTHVWSYEDDRVIGKIGYVPIEEYSFFILQTFLSGFWTYFIQRRFAIKEIPSQSRSATRLVLSAMLVLWVASVFFLANPELRYMGLILAWSLPVIMLQWAVGGPYLLHNLKVYIFSLLPATIYLCLVDAIAIHLQVWKISMTQTTGLFIGPLPIEEATFFLVTNIMLIQGLILFKAMREKYPILMKLNFFGKWST
jgi:putative membrane protein